jgi:two-component system cell cycle sensor histidine kinase/response regulator CckA
MNPIRWSFSFTSWYTERVLEPGMITSDQMYRWIVEAVPEGIWTVDPQGRTVFSNRRMAEILGASYESMAERTCFDCIYPADLEEAQRRFSQCLNGDRTPFDFRLCRTDGSPVWVTISCMMVRDDSGTPLGLLGLFTDITARIAEAENARLQAQFLQAQKMESIGRLAGGVAHDFNNILTVINGYSAAILDRMSPSDPLRGRIMEIYKAGDRAASLVRQLLAFSRKQILKQELIDLNEMVADMETMLRPLVREDVEIVTRLEPALAPVLADRHQMEQVVMNLAVNARDAMPKGGTLTIETGQVVWEGSCPHFTADARPGPYIRISVRDTGTGMDDEVRQHLFEPFFTTKGVGKGTGLGLSTVHGIVLQSGGHIDVETKPGEGTCFHIYLPAVEARRAAPGPPAASTAARGTECILLVEDQVEVRRFAATLLRECGYLVIESRDGEEALAQCAAQRLDLLLTDVVMPKMSGTELAARVRSAQPHVRVLFMSGYSDEVLSWPSGSRQNAGFIQKPFTVHGLASKVREILAEKIPSPPASLGHSNLKWDRDAGS